MPAQAQENGFAVQVEHISKRFGVLQAVNDVSFTVQRGEMGEGHNSPDVNSRPHRQPL